AQNRERNALRRADNAGALAVRTLRGRALEHARAQALARHLQETEVADAPHLDASAVEPERFLQSALDGAVVALLLHVDEVDDEEGGAVGPLQLAGGVCGRPE